MVRDPVVLQSTQNKIDAVVNATKLDVKPRTLNITSCPSSLTGGSSGGLLSELLQILLGLLG